MSYTDLLGIVKTNPTNGAHDIPTSQVIEITFNTNIDVATIDGNVYVVTALGDKVPVKISVDDLVMSIRPVDKWSSDIDYRVTVVGDDVMVPSAGFRGLKSVLGYPMAGSFTFTFRTVYDPTLPAPESDGISPPYQSVVKTSTVTLSWPAVTGAIRYEIQVSKFLTMDPMVWSGMVVETQVTPDIELTEDTYYWRVRALNEFDVPGDWSEMPGSITSPFMFGVVIQSDDPIVPDDTPPGPGDYIVLPEEITTYPQDQWPNVSLNLKRITALIPAAIDPADITLENISITKKSALDGSAEVMPVDQAKYSIEAQPQPDGSTLLIITIGEAVI